MLRTVKQFVNGDYDNLCRVEIVRENLEENYKLLSKKLLVVPVLKSNAYGHGLALVAKILDRLHPPFLCVDSLFEAWQLTKANIKTPILIMGYVPPANLQRKKLPFSFTAYDQESLLNIARYQPQAGIHLFVDTGMHREGILLAELPEVLLIIKKYKIKIAGLMSHLANADNAKNPETKKQIKNFALARKMFANAGITPKWIHLGASSAVLNYSKYRGKLGNLARVGLAMYSIKPALRFVTKIVQVKEINKGEKVGYDFTLAAKRKMQLAVLPAGYFEGIDRRLSNMGFVKINGKFCRFVGRISMNLSVVDITSVGRVKVGDEAVIISGNPKDPNSLSNIAKLCGTIPYEIAVHIQPALKRVLI